MDEAALSSTHPKAVLRSSPAKSCRGATEHQARPILEIGEDANLGPGLDELG